MSSETPDVVWRIWRVLAGQVVEGQARWQQMAYQVRRQGGDPRLDPEVGMYRAAYDAYRRSLIAAISAVTTGNAVSKAERLIRAVRPARRDNTPGGDPAT